MKAQTSGRRGVSHSCRASLGALALTFVLFTTTACGSGRPEGPPSAAPSPTGSYTDLHDQVRLKGLGKRRFDQERYWEVVGPVVEKSDRLRVRVVGESAEGRPLRTISFGRGPLSVLLWSQMHGDESTATMALADLYALVAEKGNHRMVRTILEGLTVHTLPMLNPDGAQRFQRRNAQGIDINRDARALATPEGRVLKEVRDRLEPAVGFNLHDQGIGTRVGRTDRGVAIALLSPPFDHSRAINDVRLRAMEVMGVMVESMEPLVGGHIAKYDDTFNPRAFGDLITQWGTSTILVESGGWEDDPQKQYLRKVNFVAILAALESLATGSYEGVGTDSYQALPSNGRRIGDLLITGGTVVIPGLPPFRADLLVNYGKPLLEEDGTIGEIGDLAEVEARDTLSLDGMYIHPRDRALDRSDGGVQIRVGAPAVFTVSRKVDGTDPLWTFRGGPPEEIRRRR
jgi:hypothetical protein